MAKRAIWKGHLAIAALSCPVALYAAASSSDRVSFHVLNRKTGNRVMREFVDSETGKPVDREAQVKGYEIAPESYVQLTQEEVAAAVPESDKTLKVTRFVPCDAVETVYFDKPYYIAPDGPAAAEAFALIRAALEQESVAALARGILFRRVRTMVIRVHGDGLVGSTLNFVDEIKPPDEVFDEIGEIDLDDEMIDLARHIITTKEGQFDPAGFEDRYDAALVELVKAKMEGRKIKPPRAPKVAKGDDLREALRKSAEMSGKGGGKETAKAGGKAAGRGARKAG